MKGKKKQVVDLSLLHDDGDEQQGTSPSALVWARDLLASGRRTQAEAELARAAKTLAAISMYPDALALQRELLKLRPRDVEAHQKLVEYAVRYGEPDELVAAFLELGACLLRNGARAHARMVYFQVLEIDPGNESAQAGIRRCMRATTPVPEPDTLETRFVTEPAHTGDEARDFATLLAAFREKLGEHVGVEDAASHFDLGLGFREMGLLDEAIEEFQTALAGGSDPLKVHEELGHCYLLKGEPEVAEMILLRATELPEATEEGLVGIYYQLGRCLEELGRPADARRVFQHVVRLSPRFADAAERLARL